MELVQISSSVAKLKIWPIAGSICHGVRKVPIFYHCDSIYIFFYMLLNLCPADAFTSSLG